MTTITDLMQYSSEILKIIGFKEDIAETIVLGIIAISVLSGLNLIAYMVLREPTVLEHWKYPNLVVLGTSALFGLLSFLVAYLIILALVVLSLLFEKDEFFNPPFFIILVYMQLYMLIVLFLLKKPSGKPVATSMVPQVVPVFIEKTIEVFGMLFFFIITLFLLHGNLNTGLLNLGELTNLQKAVFWVASVFFACFTMLIGFSVSFGREKVRENIKCLKSKLLKLVQLFWEKTLSFIKCLKSKILK